MNKYISHADMVDENIDYWIEQCIQSVEATVEPYWEQYKNWVEYDFLFGPSFLVHRHKRLKNVR